jgi:hypothetical protein
MVYSVLVYKNIHRKIMSDPGYAHATYTVLCVAFLFAWISSYILRSTTSRSDDDELTMNTVGLMYAGLRNDLLFSMIDPLLMLAIGATVLAVLHAFVLPTILGNDNEAMIFCGLNLMYPHFKLCFSHFIRKIYDALMLVVIVCLPTLMYTVPTDKLVICILWSSLVIVIASFASS